MGLLVTTTFGLIVWIVLWAEGIKSFDAFMATILIVLLAVIGRAAAGLRPGARGE